MNRFFYGKLAINNLKKNQRLYIPYFLTAIGMIAMVYIMNSITNDTGMQKMQVAVQEIMKMGTIVVGIFATLFLFYTNSFLMKQRKKEFGLYNILGMEKRHISKIMLCETCLFALVSLVVGLIFGIILNKYLTLILLRLIHIEVPFGFQLYPGSILMVLGLFGCIFSAILMNNLWQIHLSNPIELIRSKNQGEKEPKSRWLITMIGLAALASAYYIAIATEDPMQALLLFFVAVLLVMLGTYLLFTAGSVTVLKLMRKNKNYYYKTKHFTAVSGMIYRMKQNAMGLANICILSTVVLVMVSATVCLYVGTKNVAERTYLEFVYGGLLFLGILLGVVFLMATVLIIYYKQISEGYEDRERFIIMRKVGMSEAEVRSSIKSQILKVFFLPLITAGIHVMVAFPMLKRLLLLFGMTNNTLFLICTMITILSFGVIYGLVYSWTAKAYYKIVKS